MITFYRTEDCPSCSHIQDVLEELCVAHKVIIVQKGDNKLLPKGVNAPCIIDDKRIAQGKDEMLEYLDELEEFKELWYKYQSDACYCEPDTEV